MASPSSEQTDQKPPGSAGGLSLNLSSNNPFRNRAVSPSGPQSPASPFDDPPPRPSSRNPFLDSDNKPVQRVASPAAGMAAKPTDTASPTAEALFDSLTIDDKDKDNKGEQDKGKEKEVVRPGPNRPDGARPPPGGTRPPPGSRRGPGPPRRENMPPPGRRGPPPNHRPTRSQEEALRARRPPGNGNPFDPTSPERRPGGRPRRNSESSVADPDKPMTEEEKKARDARRRERERRHREARDKRPPNRKLDIIDQLDATSIYGTGLFHHDGPFDALNPHRNRKDSRRAPMQAFPKDSLNNVLGGSGPLNARPDHATFMGNSGEEAFRDYAGAAKDNPDYDLLGRPKKGEMPVFDPLSRGSILHGDETLGLGTSTFLEGTPAARTAIQRREAETAADTVDGGLARKKSLAQRIRSINRGPRDYSRANPEAGYASRRSPGDLTSPTSASMTTPSAERNPFFQEYDPKRGEESISVRKIDSVTGAAPTTKSPPMSPQRGAYSLERRATTDATSPQDDQQSGKQLGGLLARVRSLKGGRKGARPPEPAAQGATSAAQGATPATTGAPST